MIEMFWIDNLLSQFYTRSFLLDCIIDVRFLTWFVYLFRQEMSIQRNLWVFFHHLFLKYLRGFRCSLMPKLLKIILINWQWEFLSNAINGVHLFFFFCQIIHVKKLSTSSLLHSKSPMNFMNIYPVLKKTRRFPFYYYSLTVVEYGQ